MCKRSAVSCPTSQKSYTNGVKEYLELIAKAWLNKHTLVILFFSALI